MNRLLDRWFWLPRGYRIVLILGVAVALWQAAVVYFKIPSILVPTPSSVIERVYEAPAFYLMHTWRTLYETLVGFGLAVIFGIALAVLIISSRFLEETIYVLLIAFNGIPKVAIAPLFVVWMGTGLGPKFAISATIAIFVIVIDLVLGLRSVEPEMLDLARSMKGGRFKTLLLIRFPHALPNLFAGMKVGITLALIGSIVGEFVASDHGLGYLIMVAQGAFDTAQIFAAVVILGVLGMALFFAIDYAERLCVPWHVSRRASDAQERVVAVG